MNSRYWNKIISFIITTNLKFLCTSNKIYVDGTFDYCAKFFCQLFTIHAFKNGHYAPVAFMLLPNKCSSTYSLGFKLLIECCKDINLDFSPPEVICDFELAIHLSIKDVWSLSTISGCRFHLTQAWFKKLQNLGLTSEYNNSNSEIGSWLHWTFGLVFLNHDEVGDCFAEDFYSVIPNNSRVTQYADYLVCNYIDESALFPPHLWASCTATLEKTTNCCEASHSHFNSSFYSPHPDIFKFISVLTLILYFKNKTHMVLVGQFCPIQNIQIFIQFVCFFFTFITYNFGLRMRFANKFLTFATFICIFGAVGATWTKETTSPF